MTDADTEALVVEIEKAHQALLLAKGCNPKPFLDRVTLTHAIKDRSSSVKMVWIARVEHVSSDPQDTLTGAVYALRDKVVENLRQERVKFATEADKCDAAIAALVDVGPRTAFARLVAEDT